MKKMIFWVLFTIPINAYANTWNDMMVEQQALKKGDIIVERIDAPVQVVIKNTSGNPLPKYESSGASGLDIRAAEDVQIPAFSARLVPTGIYVKIPRGFEIQIRPRSGLAIKHSISVLNTPGTIDSDYRGEIKVILMNYSSTMYSVYTKDRIAQMVLTPVEKVVWKPHTGDNFEDTERGAGGFGSTGIVEQRIEHERRNNLENQIGQR